MALVKYDISFLTQRQPWIEKFIESKYMSDLFDHGAFIAGGFVRNLLINDNFANYSSIIPTPGSSYLNNLYNSKHEEDNLSLALFFSMLYDSDIDVFFKGNINVESFIPRGAVGKKDSFGLKATEFFIHPQRLFVSSSLQMKGPADLWNPTAKMQLVHFRFGSVEATLDTFDITNCRVAFDNKNIWIDDMFFELESKNTLDVSIISESLPHRVAKYCNRRGLTELSPRTKKAIQDWLRKYSEPGQVKGSKDLDVRKRMIRHIFTFSNIDHFSDSDHAYLVDAVYENKNICQYEEHFGIEDGSSQHKPGLRMHKNVDIVQEMINKQAQKTRPIRKSDVCILKIDSLNDITNVETILILNEVLVKSGPHEGETLYKVLYKNNVCLFHSNILQRLNNEEN